MHRADALKAAKDIVAQASVTDDLFADGSKQYCYSHQKVCQVYTGARADSDTEDARLKMVWAGTPCVDVGTLDP